MRNAMVWRRLLGFKKTVIENVEMEDSGPSDIQVVVVSVRPTKSARNRCGRCQRRCRGYDHGQGRRRWRALDCGTVQVLVEAEAPRVTCRTHGEIVASVPWARHGAGHTRSFDQTIAWLATVSSKSAVTRLMRVAWRTVGEIVDRVWADTEKVFDRYASLRRIGIDEISYKKGHKYLTVVVDHDSGRLVWAGEGRTKATLGKFFDKLGPERCALITHVSADGADWIATVVSDRCRNAVRCADPFHITKWATDAMDSVRRGAWNAARKAAETSDANQAAKALKNSRYALWKNPEDLTDRQQIKLAWVAKTDPKLYRAYLLKEGLRTVLKMPLHEATAGLQRWISWARRSRIPEFVHLQRRITKHMATILASIEHGLTNGLVESMNTKIRLITRMAFGFKSPDALIALALLGLGGQRPELPGRK
ncbi:TPA: ISL3 family transposase [Candidatus Micrarchaeota archaeon]|nr:ISL3 family transposase [Candidatus Micrarchaeota archaeon]